MDPGYAAYYRRLYDEHWWWRARERILVRLLEDISPSDGWGQILDVGCGDGLFFPILKRWGDVTGVEPDPATVSDPNRPEGRIHVVDFVDDFHPDQSYGLILMLDVLEHLDDPSAALRRVRALLRPGGVLLATVPAFNLIWTHHDDLNRHRTRYTRESFDVLVRESGLTTLRSRYGFQALFLAKLFTRALESASTSEPAIPSIPSPGINRLLAGICSIEHRIAAPLRIPFGSSLINVCTAANEEASADPWSTVRG